MRILFRWLASGMLLFGVALTLLWVAATSPWFIDAPNEADFAGFQAQNQEIYTEFEQFLAAKGVADVAPVWHLWRQGTDWRALGEPPFAIPPRELWPGMVETLRVVRDKVVPIMGPVEIVSAFRTSVYNERAGGSKGSRHKYFEAVDVVPIVCWPRPLLHSWLLGWWSQEGESLKLGLGLYARTRFHVDTWKYRKW
jgi:hypothetical protein